MVAVAFSTTVLWQQLIPSWLAFASLGTTLVAVGITSDERFGRIRLKRRNAGKRRVSARHKRF
jgi:hypothetical protein